MQLQKKHWSYQLVIVIGILISMSFAFTRPGANTLKKTAVAAATTVSNARSFVAEKIGLYDSLGLASKGLSREAFEYALSGYDRLATGGKLLKEGILSILDFTQSSGKKRLFVIDLQSGELVFNTYAAHGRGSGTDMAKEFSNKANSNKSSLGFYVTGETYIGKHGESLRLNGEEKGFNDNALARGIVMHSAAYADENIVATQGYIGRSQGCPALPQNLSKDIITKLKNGTCLFLYSPDKNYLTHSPILNS